MQEFIHIIHSDFSRNVGKNLDWFKYRLKVLENYTLKSLIGQTNKNFYYVVYLRKCFPEVLVPELKRILVDSGLNHSIIYYDKENDIRNRITTDFPEAKYIYATRIDSDDMFQKDVVEEIQSYKFEWRRALIYQRGYCYDCINKKMRHHLVSCPPFHTVMYPYETYLDLETAAEYRTTSGGHDTIISGMNSIILSDNKYIVLFHDMNNRSRYQEYPNRPDLKRIEYEDHAKILQEFNTNEEVWNELKKTI